MNWSINNVLYFLAYFPSFQHSRCQVWEGKAYCLTKYYIHFIYLNYIEGNTTKKRDYQIEYIATNWIKKNCIIMVWNFEEWLIYWSKWVQYMTEKQQFHANVWWEYEHEIIVRISITISRCPISQQMVLVNTNCVS